MKLNARIATAGLISAAAALSVSLLPSAAQAASSPQPGPGRITSPIRPSAPQAGSWFQIRNRKSGKCLDDTNGSTSRGTQLQMWRCNGLANQNWTYYLIAGGGGWPWEYMFYNQKSGLCLSNQGGSKGNGSHVILWTCSTDGADNAEWWLPYSVDTSGYNIFENLASRTLMTVSANSTADGAKVQMWTPPSINDNSYFWKW